LELRSRHAYEKIHAPNRGRSIQADVDELTVVRSGELARLTADRNRSADGASDGINGDQGVADRPCSAWCTCQDTVQTRIEDQIVGRHLHRADYDRNRGRR
jgi:hypothetical protein